MANTPVPQLLKMDGKLAAITGAAEQLDQALTDFRTRFHKLDNTKQFPQAAMLASLRLAAIAKAIEGAQEAFKEAAIKHHEKGGPFEPGKIAITITDSSRTSPKWQDEAIEAARKLTESQGLSFDKDGFIETVKGKYEPSVSTQVKLVESL